MPFSQLMRISIHAPHTRGDRELRRHHVLLAISIHAPHTRGDSKSRSIGNVPIIFQSTPLIRGATKAGWRDREWRVFQSTPLIRGATCYVSGIVYEHVISIHAPHTRGDMRSSARATSKMISIHAPHTRGDTTRTSRTRTTWHFNPRPSYEGRPQHIVQLKSNALYVVSQCKRSLATSAKKLLSHINIRLSRCEGAV